MNPIRTSSFSIILFSIVLSLAGLLLIPRIQLHLTPNYTYPSLQVRCSYPGSSPEELERMIISPLEASFQLVPGIRRMYSVSGRNSGYINLEVDKHRDLDHFRFEIASKIRQIYPSFPLQAQYPVISVNRPDEQEADRPILSYALYGSDESSRIYQYVLEQLSPRLAMIEGLRKLEILGGNTEEWVIRYDNDRLTSLDLRPEQISREIQRKLTDLSLGRTQLKNEEYNIQLNKSTIPSFDRTILPKPGGYIRLDQLAQTNMEEKRTLHYYRINGKNSIRLNFLPDKNANHLVLARNIKNLISREVKSLPSDYELFLEYDTTQFLQRELDKIRDRSLLSVGILLFFVLLTYRNVKHFTIVLLSLIVNLGVACIFYYLLGVQLNLYALAGITVSLGIIIDNTIVMIHHIRKHRNIQVFPALITATLTTISALVVIKFLPDQWQWSLIDFAKVIGINLAVSLLVSLLFIPSILHQWKLERPALAGSKHAKAPVLAFRRIYSFILARLLKIRWLAISCIILLFGLPVFELPNQIEGKDWYNKTLGNDWYVEQVKPHINKWLGGTLRLFVYYVYEGSGFRETSETKLHVNGRMPEGSTIEQLNAVILSIEKYLSKYPEELSSYITNIYSGQRGNIEISFNPGYSNYFPFVLKSRLESYALNHGGVQWQIYGVGKGFSNASGQSMPRFRLTMKGYNKDLLNTYANQFAEILERHPRIREVDRESNINWWERDVHEYLLDVDYKRLAETNFHMSQLMSGLNLFNENRRYIAFTPDNIGVRIENQDIKEMDLWQLENRFLPQDSSVISYQSLMDLNKIKVANAIHKEDQQYLQLLNWEYTGSGRFGSRYLNECMEQFVPTLPLGYSMERQQYSYSGGEKAKQYWLILIIIGIIFFLCSIHFESLRAAMIIILLIPSSFIGVFLTFYWFDLPFDQGGYTSFILLSGIVVNSLILILSDYYRLLRRNLLSDPVRQYVRAFQRKIVPILLTIISTSLGLIPFMMHGQGEVFWYALAAGTIGGLVFSLLVLFVFVPVFFLKLARK